jgi:capsular polysaccharide transport system permease protein
MQKFLSTGEGRKTARRVSFASRLALLLLPSLLAAAYYGLFAADQYVSEARVVVRDAADQPASSGLAQLAAQSREGNAALALRDYLMSRDAMHGLAAGVDLRADWAGSARDPFSRLRAGASDEDLFSRYGDLVSVVVNGNSGVVTLKCRAFRSADAQVIAKNLLALGAASMARLSDAGHLTLIPLVTPNLPDAPAEPQRLRIILTVLGFNLIFVAMAWLVGTGLREHAAKDR